ncbi:YncE family protein [Salinimicrobium oceani]|uniref:YncE family protein n=1 Tax=Salinimicrobium oceani TaxID=2722702 RepID=A0ABX1CWV3_9FLAO|nr:DUF5074 domain-containing protein [Salinimicrobium oceani]NJW52758.1 YncE family protein [Salinimicrobium oceani]
MQFKNLLYLFLSLVILVSCESDDDNIIPPQNGGTYSDGVFIINEGNFGQGNSTISFLNAEGEVTHNIFSTVNGADLGDTATDIGLFEELVFIVVNVSNKIEIVDRSTFETVATIDTGLNNPRKIAFLDGKTYVTNWGDGSDPNDDFIAVFDSSSFELITTIAVAEGPEDILATEEKVFVAHLGGWSFNDKISVISEDEVEKTIEVGAGPNAMAAGNGFLWVSSSGLPDYLGETAGSISKISLSTLEVVQEYIFEEAEQHPGNLSLNNDNVYFTQGTDVYSFGTSETTLPASAAFSLEAVAYLYGFDLIDGNIYAASADPNFTGNGTLYVYDAATGNLSASYETGVNPNGVFSN